MVRMKSLFSFVFLVCMVMLPVQAATNTDVDPEDVVATKGSVIPPRPPAGTKHYYDIPEPLSLADAALYRLIFAAQEADHFDSANAYIRELSDRSLLGEVYGERYATSSYKSSYPEMKRWLQNYIDHPQSETIYRLAMRRKPRKASSPPIPESLKPSLRSSRERGLVISSYQSTKNLSSKQRRKLARYVWQINRYVKRGAPTQAKRILNNQDVKRLADTVEWDSLQARIAGGYFTAHKFKDAFNMAHAAASRSGQHYPVGHWTAGLAAWRLKNYAAAAPHFAALAQSELASDRVRAGGAFWAARAYVKLNQSSTARQWLQYASKEPRTFYGLLAIRALNNRPSQNWQAPQLTQSDVDDLVDNKTTKRAMALVQVGEYQLAERALMGLVYEKQLVEPIAKYALQAALPYVAIRSTVKWEETAGHIYDAAIYPLTVWEPLDGFKLDKAILHAFMHQESNLRPTAKSHAGARGLMQLMPATAQYMGRQNFRGKNGDKLFQPEFNMMLGQKYIRYLMGKEEIGNNIVMLASAYNGGLGNLRKWLKKDNYDNDPLLFIESIPLEETKGFVKKITSKLWIYRSRFGQPSPSLDQMMAGEWPRYAALDKNYPVNLYAMHNGETARRVRRPVEDVSPASPTAQTNTGRSKRNWAVPR